MDHNAITKQNELIHYLRQFVTDDRLYKMHTVLNNRTRYLTAVLEDIYQPHNASAVLRSCDACGIQDVHIIENRNSHSLSSGVELGTAQWLTRHRYREREDNTAEAINELRERGYRIVAATPHQQDVTPSDFRLDGGPTAILFGTEMEGLSAHALELADEYIRIPMYGFVESFNISVSAAVILTRLMERLRASEIPWQLSRDEQAELELSWLRNSIKRVESLERRFFE